MTIVLSPIVGLWPVIGATAFWLVLWLISGVIGRDRWEVRAILSITALAAMIAIASTFADFFWSPDGNWATALSFVIYGALLVEVSPFVISILVNRRV